MTITELIQQLETARAEIGGDAQVFCAGTDTPETITANSGDSECGPHVFLE